MPLGPYTIHIYTMQAQSHKNSLLPASQQLTWSTWSESRRATSLQEFQLHTYSGNAFSYSHIKQMFQV